MRITFDPVKNERNIAQRGLSFALTQELEWDSALAVEDTRRDYGETRLRILALLHGRLHAVVVTPAKTNCASSVLEKPTGRSRNTMNNTEKPNASHPDDDNPEWTQADIAKARPAAEVLAKFVGAAATEQLLRRGKGRPPKEDRKVNQTLRLDPDVLNAYRQEGRGWQAHINDVLRQNMPKYK